jgi:hypothetical protein
MRASPEQASAAVKESVDMVPRLWSQEARRRFKPAGLIFSE